MIRIEWTLNFLFVGPVVGSAEVVGRASAASALREAMLEAVGEKRWTPEHERGMWRLEAFVLSGASPQSRLQVPGVTVVVTETPEE